MNWIEFEFICGSRKVVVIRKSSKQGSNQSLCLEIDGFIADCGFRGALKESAMTVNAILHRIFIVLVEVV